MARLPLLRLFSLAIRQLLRDARAGELRVLFFALVVAVAASTAIGYFGARLNGAMMLRATEFLGADLLLEGSSPARPEQIKSGTELGLEHAQVVEFSSVIATDNGIQLSSIKAADDVYPLRGELKSAPAPFAPEEAGGGPKPGEAWVEARLLTALDLKIGDSIDVGLRTLKLARVLTYEPDRAGNFYSLTPRVLINLSDLAATGVVQPGSRVSYRELWRGKAEALETYRQLIKPGLAANQRIQDARDGNRQIGGALGKAERYLNMASLVAVLLSGVAVALSATRFATRRFDASALLRCLGLSRRETMVLFSLQLTVLGLLASLGGALLGWLAQLGLFALLHDLLPTDVPPGGLFPAFAGIGTGLVALAGFALPPLAALGRVPPLRVLRRDMLPDSFQHLDGLWRCAGRPRPDHVAPEPRPGADLRPARRRRDRGGHTRRVAVAATQKLASDAGTRFIALAPRARPTASSSTGGCRTSLGLRFDPVVHGADRFAAWRVTGHLAEPVTEKRTELFRPEHPARRQTGLHRSTDRAVSPIGAAVPGGAGTTDQHQRRAGTGNRQQGFGG
ncbi:hypothetical protein OKW12_003395 [Pseudomonas silensiensis]|nr:hypothetical protein [Pseudomonas silensiensis]